MRHRGNRPVANQVRDRPAERGSRNGPGVLDEAGRFGVPIGRVHSRLRRCGRRRPRRRERLRRQPRPPQSGPTVPSIPPLTPMGDGGSYSKGHEETKSKGSGHPPEIKLRDKSDSLTPERHGAGMAESNKITVKARRSKLTATLTVRLRPLLRRPTLRGTAQGPVGAGVRSHPARRLRRLVGLKMTGKLDGDVRREANGSTCLRSADAAVYPACGGGPVLWPAFPPCCAPPGAARRCHQEVELPPQDPPRGALRPGGGPDTRGERRRDMPGARRGRVAPGPRVGTWDPQSNPISRLDGKGFGLALTLKVRPTPSRAE